MKNDIQSSNNNNNSNNDNDNNKMEELAAFYTRIESACYKPIGEGLDKLIQKRDLLDILNYMLPNHSDGQTKSNNPNDTKHLWHATIANLKPGDSCRLPKETSGLKRTCNVIRSRTGEYKLFLETKSKLADHSKRTHKNHIREGAQKKGKPAWRLDVGEIEYFNLVVRDEIANVGSSSSQQSTNSKNIENFVQEAKLAQQLRDKMASQLSGNEPSLADYELSAIFNKTNPLTPAKTQQKLSGYSIKGNDSLDKLMKTITELPVNDKYKLILELLNAIKVIHDSGYVYQDAKPSNIIIFQNIHTHQYHLKLSDYGVTLKITDEFYPQATLGYESPEICRFYNSEAFINEPIHNYYFNMKKESFARSIVLEEPKVNKPLTDSLDLANDMWAVGIIAFQLLHNGRMPTPRDWGLIQSNTLLRGFLQIDRDQRFDINQAISECTKLIHEPVHTHKKK